MRFSMDEYSLMLDTAHNAGMSFNEIMKNFYAYLLYTYVQLNGWFINNEYDVYRTSLFAMMYHKYMSRVYMEEPDMAERHDDVRRLIDTFMLMRNYVDEFSLHGFGQDCLESDERSFCYQPTPEMNDDHGDVNQLLRTESIKKSVDRTFGSDFWIGYSLDERFEEQFIERFNETHQNSTMTPRTTTIRMTSTRSDGAGISSDHAETNIFALLEIFENSCQENKDIHFLNWVDFVTRTNLNAIPSTGLIKFKDGAFAQQIVSENIMDPKTWKAVNLPAFIASSFALIKNVRIHPRRDVPHLTHGLIIVDKNQRPVVAIFKKSKHFTVEYFWNGYEWVHIRKNHWQEITKSGLSLALLDSPQFMRCNG